MAATALFFLPCFMYTCASFFFSVSILPSKEKKERKNNENIQIVDYILKSSVNDSIS